MHGLVNKIAAAAGATQNLSLDVKNISSLSPSDASAARQVIEAELTQRHYRLVAPTSSTATPIATPGSVPASEATAQVQVTFSEGVEGFIWVAEIRQSNQSEDDRQVAMVTFSKPSSDVTRGVTDSLTLAKRLVWEQPGKFLDFSALPQSAGSNSTLLILEPGRLIFYRSSGAQWQLWQSVSLPLPNPKPRDGIGHIDSIAQKISLTGLECAGDFQQPQSLKCAPAGGMPANGMQQIPGHEGSETATLAEKCGDGNIVLGTGTGDWTQPDSIQGFEMANSQAQPIASGDPIDVDGPVISFWAQPNESDARAVVYNLKTGHYEGYVVTATCNH